MFAVPSGGVGEGSDQLLWARFMLRTDVAAKGDPMSSGNTTGWASSMQSCRERTEVGCERREGVEGVAWATGGDSMCSSLRRACAVSVTAGTPAAPKRERHMLQVQEGVGHMLQVQERGWGACSRYKRGGGAHVPGTEEGGAHAPSTGVGGAHAPGTGEGRGTWFATTLMNTLCVHTEEGLSHAP